MDEKVGEVFSIAKDNRPVMGCTISKTVQNGRSAVTYTVAARSRTSLLLLIPISARRFTPITS